MSRPGHHRYLSPRGHLYRTTGPSLEPLKDSEVTEVFVVADSNTDYSNDNTYTYDGNSHQAAYHVFGVGAPTPASITCTTDRNAGSYPASCSGVNNYNQVSPTDLIVYVASGSTYTDGAGIHTGGTLIINQRPITVTAASAKVYDGTIACPNPTCTTGPMFTPGGAAPALGTGDTANFIEAFDNRNVGSTHKVTPSGIVNDGGSPAGSNYLYTFVSINTGAITPATLTITASTNTKYYDSTPSAAAIPATSVTCGTTPVAGPPSLCGGDTITGLTETYNSPNAANPTTLSVANTYTVNDGNNGNNYTVVLKTNTTGVINAAPVTVTAGSYTGTYDGHAHSPAPLCAFTPTSPSLEQLRWHRHMHEQPQFGWSER